MAFLSARRLATERARGRWRTRRNDARKGERSSPSVLVPYRLGLMTVPPHRLRQNRQGAVETSAVWRAQPILLDSHRFLWSSAHIMAGDSSFEWDGAKDRVNQAKHGIAFAEAQHAFFDPHRVIAEDLGHSRGEQRYF